MARPPWTQTIAQKQSLGILQQKFQTGLNLHRQGKLSDAAKLYEEVIKHNQEHFGALHLLGVICAQTRQFERAAELISKAIKIDPENAEAYSNRGVALKELRRFEDALASYDKAIALKPHYADAHSNRGMVLQELRRFEDALASYDKAISLKSDHTEAHYNRGNALKELKRFEEAIASYDKVISLKSNYMEAYTNRGIALTELSRFEDALASHDKAISLKPEFAEAYCNRGNALIELKRPEEAIASFDKAISLKPGYADAYYSRGIALLELSRFEDVLASNDKGIALKPHYAEAYNIRGVALNRLKRRDEALANYNKAIELKPDFAEAYINRGHTLIKLKRLDEALASYTKAIELKPDFAEAYINRGHTLMKLKRLDEALASYTKAIELKPEIDFLIGHSLLAKMSLCDWTNIVDEREKLHRQIEANQKACLPFASLALFDSPALQRKFAEVYADSMDIVSSYFGPIPEHFPKDKIRIGYFSPDFREHPVSYLTAEMFELHSKEKFETTAFSFSGQKTDDEMRRRLKNAFDSFIDVTDKSDEEVARLSRRLKIDIAVDLAGYTENSRPRIFNFRAAPIQVSYIGYLGTLGTTAMDYLISDRVIIPKSSETDYSEKIVWLPSYQVNDSKRPISERVFSKRELGIPEKDFVFCCFNNNYKISPEVFSSWMRILKSVKNSVLLLFLGNKTVEENLRREAQVRGVDPNRLVFAGKLPRDQYIARFRCADLFLDTSPYNAGTMASDALWAGLPVLTCLGKTFAGRVCASILASIGLSDLITRTSEEYETLAIELATQSQKLSEIRYKLNSNRLTTRLFDCQRFTKDIESAYCAMFERYNNNLPPDHIFLQPQESVSDHL